MEGTVRRGPGVGVSREISSGVFGREVSDGEPKLSVINAVRFKLLARVISVVKNDKEYVKKPAKLYLF